MSVDARLARWTAPLAVSCPDARQHPAFEAIRAETAKLESPSAGPTDWAEVLRVGDAFLAEVGRDLFIASALASALAHREGIAGATLGAQLVARLLADASLSPTRPRARANALLAYVARAEISLDAAKDRTRATLEPLEAALRELATTASATLGDEAPSLRPLQERVRAALDALPPPAAPPPPPPIAPAAVFAPPPPLPTAPTALAAPEALPDRAEQVPAFVRRVAGQLVPAAALARRAPFDADALRLTLVALYLPITSAPETTRDSKTALAAPPKLVLETLHKQLDSAAPEVLARDALAAIERHRFALDGHAALARALERGGTSARAAREIHRHELRGLCARLPELLDREFADGTRFASPATRALFASWEPTAPAAEPADAADPVAEVRALAREGRTAEALTLGGRLRHEAASSRARLDATLAMALAAEEARALPLASELHAELVRLVDQHALESWEPALAATVLRAATRVAGAVPGSDALARSLFARLARVDARAAFDLSSSIHATPPKPVR